MDGAGAEIYQLPEECVAYAISLTTPGDACHSSAVSPAFKDAADDSDAVWARFLPTDCAAVLARADDDDHVVLDCASKKKELLARLCDSPSVLLDGATMSFGLERRSGAKCFMLSARALSIVWGDDPTCWIWTTANISLLLPGSRFPEVAELSWTCAGWRSAGSCSSRSLLTPGTTYAAYLVYGMAEDSYGLECNVGIPPPKATLTVVVPGTGGKTTEHPVCLQHMHGGEEETAVHRRKQQYTTRLRKGYGAAGQKMMLTLEADPDIWWRAGDDGWAEVELGVAAAGDEDGVVEVSLTEIDSHRWKRGLIVQGIEIRAKHTS